MDTIHVTPAMVPPWLRAGYRGRKFQVVITGEVDIPETAGHWDAGSRDTYFLANLNEGSIICPLAQTGRFTIAPRYVVLQRTILSGKDLGNRYYVNPDDAAKLLPTPDVRELSQHERLALIAAVSFRPHYAGRDRYEMMRQEHYRHRLTPDEFFPTREQWKVALQTLRRVGYLNASNSVTIDGRNRAARER